MLWEPGKQYQICYTNASFESSVRTIDVLSTSRASDGRVYIRAFCHLRGSERTFRADRISYYGNARPTSARMEHARAEKTWYQTPKTAPVAYTTPTLSTEPSSASHLEESSSGSGAKIMGTLFILVFAFASIISYNESKPSTVPSPFQGNTSNTNVATIPTPLPKPSPPPKPALEVTTIAGFTLKTVRTSGIERFEVPELGLVTMNKLEAVSAIRLPRIYTSDGFFQS
jgi:hypothetical protein